MSRPICQVADSFAQTLNLTLQNKSPLDYLIMLFYPLTELPDSFILELIVSFQLLGDVSLLFGQLVFCVLAAFSVSTDYRGQCACKSQPRCDEGDPNLSHFTTSSHHGNANLSEISNI
jgi:hypothetical protein